MLLSCVAFEGCVAWQDYPEIPEECLSQHGAEQSPDLEIINGVERQLKGLETNEPRKHIAQVLECPHASKG